MENVVLAIHLILASLLVGIVLLQRSEGGGLGIGGGNGGMMSGRTAANALTKLTWLLASMFIATSVTLTIFSTERSRDDSILDQIDMTPPKGGTQAGEGLLPPRIDETGPATPPKVEAD